jgi:hypothetical protein
VPGLRALIVVPLDWLFELKYPCAFSRLAISAGLITPYLCCLTARTSDPARGEFGLDGGLLTFSGMEVAGLKPSNCLEYLLLEAGVGMARLPELGGRGEPEDDGVYASRPAKES